MIPREKRLMRERRYRIDLPAVSVPTRVADQIEAAQESMKNAHEILLALVQDPQITKNLQSVLEQLYSELDEKAGPIMGGFADLLDTEVNVYAEGRAQRKNKMKITKRQLRRIIREFVDMPTQEREWLDQMGVPRQVLDQAAGPSLKPEVEEAIAKYTRDRFAWRMARGEFEDMADGIEIPGVSDTYYSGWEPADFQAVIAAMKG